MSTKENKELIRKAYEELNSCNGDISKLPPSYVQRYAPTFIGHSTLEPGDHKLEKVMKSLAMLFAAFPDMKGSIEDQVAQGDKVASRYVCRGTHKGSFGGIPTTGKQVVMNGVQIDKIANGKRVECWDFPDIFGLMTQLGVIPPTAPKM